MASRWNKREAEWPTGQMGGRGLGKASQCLTRLAGSLREAGAGTRHRQGTRGEKRGDKEESIGCGGPVLELSLAFRKQKVSSAAACR